MQTLRSMDDTATHPPLNEFYIMMTTCDSHKANAAGRLKTSTVSLHLSAPAILNLV